MTFRDCLHALNKCTATIVLKRNLRGLQNVQRGTDSL